MSELLCGCTTEEKPFSYEASKSPTFVILFRKEYFATITWRDGGEEAVKDIIKALNTAYIKGFTDCGSELIPKLMKEPK